jgi:hypothetical protein
MKIHSKFKRIQLQIIIVILIGFFGTFIGDYISSIGGFGDYVVNSTRCVHFGVRIDGSHVHWGARHYWYVYGAAALVITSIIKIINDVVEL